MVQTQTFRCSACSSRGLASHPCTLLISCRAEPTQHTACIHGPAAHTWASSACMGQQRMHTACMGQLVHTPLAVPVARFSPGSLHSMKALKSASSLA